MDVMNRYCALCKEYVLVTNEDLWLSLPSGVYICDDCILSEAKKIRENAIDLKEFSKAINEDEVCQDS